MQRHSFHDGTVFSVQHPDDLDSARTVVVLFDGRPMIEAGVPDVMRSLQERAIIGPLTAIYVESIEGSTTRGPTRVASLTDPLQLGRLVETLRRFLERSGSVTAPSDAASDEPARCAVVGHSLGGNAALHVASRWPGVFGGAATLSAALWWRGDDTHMSGSQVAAECQGARGLRLWMLAGSEEDPELLRSNREFWTAADEEGLDLVHMEHGGGHELSSSVTWLGHALPHLFSGPAGPGARARNASP